ncbi:Heterokaryon incompatibility protein 6, OR allele [Lachnellula arida]|uniref:Heterokaryon incompatibility protein 6, OR allele n=1 Tax=Lachnellula arida TaxID=1316785 RepID=A0A8T9B829_9HELO|nr:Heterokaryon incompatibility protein 6, OR allele [Lachnellula arida]
MHITQQPNASNADTDDNTSATAIKNNCTHYFPLQKNEIRVLEVLPGGEHDDVQCRLEHVLVNNPPEFNALSYTWGDPQAPKVTISVDGYDLLVTKSCKSILQELRRESMAQSKPQFIWIDAICINQSDIVERNIQVQVMGEVYRNAKKLIVRLGAEDNDIREVIEIMNELSGSPAQGAFEDWWHLHFQMHPRFLERCFAMLIFFSYPWLTRVWVIQEYVIFAQSHRKQGGKESIEFYCGRTRLESSTLLYLRRAGLLHHLLRTLETEKNLGKEEGDIALSLVTKSFHRGFVCFDRILERTRRRSPPMSKAATATELLGCIVGGLECGWTEPRDRIYAYLGILEYRRWECERDVREVHKLVRFEAISSMQAALDNLNNTEFDKQMAIVGQVFEFANLIINYDAPIEDVYSSFVSYVVLATGSLNVLSLCHRRSIYVQRTWTVDLTTIPLFIQGTKQGGGLLNPRQLLSNAEEKAIDNWTAVAVLQQIIDKKNKVRKFYRIIRKAELPLKDILRNTDSLAQWAKDPSTRFATTFENIRNLMRTVNENAIVVGNSR